MEKLYGAEELAERWHCTERTARERMRQIGILNCKPMMCRESLVDAWERRNTEAPQTAPGIPKGGARKRKNITPIKQGPLKPGQFISRVRLKA